METKLNINPIYKKVFPIDPKNKLPVIPSAHPVGDPLHDKCHGECGKEGHGFYDAVSINDLDTINRWMKRFPNCGWGSPTGEDFTVIDVDVQHGGLDTWDTWMLDYDKVDTRTNQTQHGGYHHHFSMPSGTFVHNSTSKIGQGIDVRGIGGYIAIPPTRGYSIVNDAPIAPAPAWLLEKLGVTKPLSGMKTPKPKGLVMPDKVCEGKRNDMLFRLACKLRKANMSDSAIRVAVMQENREKCEPELDEDEVDKLIASALSYPDAQIAPDTEIESAFTLTDVGNARRFVANYESTVRYCPQMGWMLWNGKFWEEDRLNRVRVYAMNTIYKIYGEAEKAQSKAIGQWAATSQSGSHIDTMLKNATALLAIDLNEFDKNPDTNYLLNLRNGVLDLKTGVLLPHNSELFLTHYVDVDYDPSAKCPKWEQFVERILPDVEKRLFVQKAAGYSLTASVDAQAWFFPYGIGANGKTTFLEGLSGFFGETLTKMIPIEALMDNGKGQGATPYTMQMFRKRMLFSTEIPMNGRLNDGVMKIISGEKRVAGRNLYKAPFEFDFTAKLWMSGNNKPEVNDRSDGFWRKVKLIGFDEVIPVEERRPMSEMLAEFKTEHSGMLNWLLNGCKLWMQDGLIEPENIRKETMEYRSEEDILQQFIEDECELGSNLESEPKDILRKLIAYMSSMNEEKPFSATRLTRELSHKGVKRTSKNGKYIGIALKVKK